MKRKVELQLAVRTLVEFVLRSGDLEAEGFSGPGRAVAGTRIHRKIQESRPEGYQAEVTVSEVIETDDYSLELSGRIDGVYQTDGTTFIEEIKSTSSTIERLEAATESHLAQAKCYAFMFATSNNLRKVTIHLTYVEQLSGKTAEHFHPFSFRELEVFFNELTGRYLSHLESSLKWQIERDGSISDLDFPFSEYRKGQRKMAVEVFRSIREKRQIIVQAPTGIGKTMAAVFPAVKAIADGLVSKIFYLTARTTGKELAEKAMDCLQSEGLKAKYVTLTAKEKMCFKPDAACTAKECQYAKGYYDKLDAAVEEALVYHDLTRERIEEVAERHQVCPFEFSLDLSISVDVIICDYNYAFDPRVKLKRFFEMPGLFSLDDVNCFLVDEAHNLVDRARDMFSADIYKSDVLSLRRALKDDLPSIYKQLGKINNWMLKKRKEVDGNDGLLIEKDGAVDLYPLLKRFCVMSENWLSGDRKTSFREEMLDLYFRMSGLLKIAEVYDSSYCTYYESSKSELRLKLNCIDPATNLKKALTGAASAVFFSATMTPMGYFRNILGCDEETVFLDLGSPFPEENLNVVSVAHISTRYKDRQSSCHDIAELVRTVAEGKKGNYLFFFPSYAYMNMIYDIFSESNEEVECVVQQPGMSEEERSDFLDRFESSNPETLIGFVVMGGIFGEGIDLVGDRLDGAVIVGVGLPGICTERDIIRDYFEEEGRGFDYAYLFPGINRVLQAGGRVIRTENDKGLIVLIDDRFGWGQYSSLLPQWWKPRSVRNNDQMEHLLKSFWVDFTN